jgi:hypothetical protein
MNYLILAFFMKEKRTLFLLSLFSDSIANPLRFVGRFTFRNFLLHQKAVFEGQFFLELQMLVGRFNERFHEILRRLPPAGKPPIDEAAYCHAFIMVRHTRLHSDSFFRCWA